MAMPAAMPATTPRRAPTIRRVSDGIRCFHKRPLFQSSMNVFRTSLGFGRVSAEMKPVRVPHSISTISSTKTAAPIQRIERVVNPPPRNGTVLCGCDASPVLSAMSAIDQLQVGRLRFFAHQRPKRLLMALQNRIAQASLVERPVDFDDLADHAGTT